MLITMFTCWSISCIHVWSNFFKGNITMKVPLFMVLLRSTMYIHDICSINNSHQNITILGAFTYLIHVMGRMYFAQHPHNHDKHSKETHLCIFYATQCPMSPPKGPYQFLIQCYLQVSCWFYGSFSSTLRRKMPDHFALW